MPASYRVFYVTTHTMQPDKLAEAMAWYEQGMGLWPRLPGVKSVQGFAMQFGLGPADMGVEIWMEIEDYAVLDSWDRIDGPIRQEWLDLMAVQRACVTPGPARLMGDLAGSVPQELGGELSPKG